MTTTITRNLAGRRRFMHSQATIAMCEAYALTGDASLKSSCERAVKFLLNSQHPKEGGWRYQPQSGESMGTCPSPVGR